MSKLYRPPRPLQVAADAAGRPVAVRWRGALYRGQAHSHWRIHTGWWEEEIWRDYYLWEGEGLLCELYRDRLRGDWYMHRVYD